MDKLLSQLIKKLYKYPIGSPEYREALEHLLSLIPHLQGICQDRHPDYSKAVDQSSEDIRQKIDGFIVTLVLKIDETPPSVLRENFVRWVNRFLRFDIYDLYRSRKLPLSLDNTRAGEEGGTTFIEQLPDPRTLDNWLEQEEAQTQRLVLKRYVEKDPDGILRKCYPTNYPQCNCQVLAKMRYLNETTVGVPALAKQFGMSAQTIYSHWKRSCLPILQEIADNYHQYLYLLKPVPLNQWFENFFDTGWQTVEYIIGNDSPNLPFVFRNSRANGVTMCKEINLGMVVSYPLALIVNVRHYEDEFEIVLRVCPTEERKYLPSNLQLIVFDDESGESFAGCYTMDDSRSTEIMFLGMQGEIFSVEITVGQASVREKFVI